MDAVEILFALENEFDINIPDDEVRTVRNVRQMCEGVEQAGGRQVRRRRAAGQVAMRRVAITGMGAICALGRNTCGVRAALCARAAPGIGPIESTDISQIALSERRRGARLLATSRTSTTAAPISSTASRSSR